MLRARLPPTSEPSPTKRPPKPPRRPKLPRRRARRRRISTAAADAAAAKAKEAQAAAAAAKAEADAAQKIVDELKAKGEKEIDNGTGVGGGVIIGEHTDDGSGVTKVDETTAVVNKTGVKLVGYYNNKGAFDVVDYYVTDADGDRSPEACPGRPCSRRHCKQHQR
ncbi:hypothetical protein GCM10020255_018250 [Rhodococcus baikonurensis]